MTLLMQGILLAPKKNLAVAVSGLLSDPHFTLFSVGQMREANNRFILA